jgi:hypothetical protein
VKKAIVLALVAGPAPSSEVGRVSTTSGVVERSFTPGDDGSATPLLGLLMVIIGVPSVDSAGGVSVEMSVPSKA